MANLKPINDYNEAQIAKKQSLINDICEFIINEGENGAAVKELCIKFKISSTSAYRYLNYLVHQGNVSCRKEGHSKVWFWAPPKETPEEAEKAEQESFEIADEICPGGRIFEEIKPAHDANQGDVVWCSSRSGDGQFFRYLVMIPWERKATVIGVIPEGHPCYNANDARYVPIGVDPETGEELFADISNTCSRGYAQFGEKLMKVSPENMSELKSVMSRYHRMAVKADVVTGFDDVWKKRAEDLGKQLSESKTHAAILEANHEEYINDIKRLSSENDDLKQQLKAAYLERDEKKQACEETQKTAKKALDENSNLVLQFAEKDAQIVDLTECNERQRRFIEELKKQEAPEPAVSADVDALLWKISLLEQELKDKDEMVTTLKQIVFKSLKGGE